MPTVLPSTQYFHLCGHTQIKQFQFFSSISDVKTSFSVLKHLFSSSPIVCATPKHPLPVNPPVWCLSGLSLSHQAWCSWAGYNAVWAHVNSFTLPGKMLEHDWKCRLDEKTNKKKTKNPHSRRKCWFNDCQGTCFHCSQGKPTEQVWLLRSVPSTCYCPKGWRADFSSCLGQMPSNPQRSIIWHYLLEMTACREETFLLSSSPTIPTIPQSSAHPHGFSLGGRSQGNYTAVSMQSQVIQDTWRIHQKWYIFSLINSTSGHGSPSLLPALQHPGIITHQSHPAFFSVLFFLSQHLQITAGEYGNPKPLLPSRHMALSFINVSGVSAL